MSSSNLTNFGARFEYLKALEEHWPTVLTDLREHTFAVYRRCSEAHPNTTALQNLDLLQAALRRRDGVEFEAVAEALEEWSGKHGFVDRWLQDAGMQTMDGWFHSQNAGKWKYFPEELDTPSFQPSFGLWLPAFSTWPEFEKITDEIYRRERNNYRATVRKLWGEDKPKVREHAIWTVQWQLGKSPEGIRNWHRHLIGQTVSVANIQLGVHAFTEAAGITLREPKAGPRAKRKKYKLYPTTWSLYLSLVYAVIYGALRCKIILVCAKLCKGTIGGAQEEGYKEDETDNRQDGGTPVD
jgi:hypothetical protein